MFLNVTQYMNRIPKALFTFPVTINVVFIATGLVSMLLTLPGLAQDPVFSRFTANPQSENPAFTGGSRNTDAYVIYRNQFPSLATNYITYALGASTFIDDLNSGFGLSVLHDDSADGLYQTSSATINYSYRLQLSNGAYVNAGLSLGVGRTEVDFNRLIFLDQIDAVTGPISSGGLPFPTEELFPQEDFVNYLDLGAGFLFYSDQLYVGASFNHLNNPANDFLVNEFETSNGVDGLPLRWSINAGYTIPLIEGRRKTILSIHPSLLYTRQRDFGQLNAGFFAKYKILDVGLTARLSGTTPDAIIASVGVKFGAASLYYAYDFTISKLASLSGGAHEIGLSTRIGPIKEAEVSCFDLFR